MVEDTAIIARNYLPETTVIDTTARLESFRDSAVALAQPSAQVIFIIF